MGMEVYLINAEMGDLQGLSIIFFLWGYPCRCEEEALLLKLFDVCKCHTTCLYTHCATMRELMTVCENMNKTESWGLGEQRTIHH